MKATALIAAFVIGCATGQTAALELKLSSPMPEQLPYVYPDLTLRLENGSANRVLLPPGGVHVQVFLDRGAGWTECHPTVDHSSSTPSMAKWDEIAAGKEKVIPVPATRCLCYGKQSTEVCHEWTDVPGTYRLKAIVSTAELQESGAAPVPEGGFRGSLESSPVEIVVKQPTGLDAEAIEWAKGSPLSVDVLKTFPGSEYAALVWYGTVRLNTADPKRIQSLIQRHLYPGPNSVPDPTSPSGWSSLDSEGVARWQIAWGERILREHPSFAYRDEARVLVALSQMSLGMKPQARATLDAVALNERTFAGRWSRDFLAAVVPGTPK